MGEFSKNKKEERIGEQNVNKDGYLMKIIKYENYNDIIVEFQDEYKAKVHTQYSCFKYGVVSNPFHKTVFDIGYIGNTKVGDGNGNHKKSYKYWFSMMDRCYNEKYLKERQSYINCTVCEEWHCYANFEKWYDGNYYEIEDKRMCLDKDILVKGNKIYSPETCCFVPNEINVLFTKNNKNRGNYPIGVYYKKKLRKYVSQCGEKIGKEKKTPIYLGAFNTPEEAFQAYKKHKEQYIKKVADKYKGQIKDNVYEALYKWEVEIDD